MILGLAETSIQLVPDGTLALHVLLIVVMVAILNRTLLRPINRILAERERRSKGTLDEARQLLATIDQRLAQNERALRGARAEGYRLMELQRKEQTGEREARLALVKDEMAKMVRDEEALIQRQVEEARRALEADAWKLGLEISSQVLGRPMQSEPQQDLNH